MTLVKNSSTSFQAGHRLEIQLKKEINEKRKLKLERDKLKYNLEAAEELVQRLFRYIEQLEKKGVSKQQLHKDNGNIWKIDSFCQTDAIPAVEEQGTKRPRKFSKRNLTNQRTFVTSDQQKQLFLKPNLALLQKFDAKKQAQFQEIINYHQKELADKQLVFSKEKLEMEQEIGKLKAQLVECELKHQRFKNELLLVQKEKRNFKIELQKIKADVERLRSRNYRENMVPQEFLQEYEKRFHSLENDLFLSRKACNRLKRKYDKVKKEREELHQRFLLVVHSVHEQTMKQKSHLVENLSRVERILEE